VVEGGVMAGLKKERKLADLPCHAMPCQEDQSCHPLQQTACHCDMWALSYHLT